MFLNAELIEDIQKAIVNLNGASNRLTVIDSVSGGSINSAYKLRFGDSCYFLKVNSSSTFPNMFLAEMEGLRRIMQSNTIAVPEVIACGQSNQEQYLLLEWIEKSASSTEFEYEFGRKLAALHRLSNSKFGLDHSNYIASLSQSNVLNESWTDFFVSERLAPQLKLAVDNDLINCGMTKDLERLFTRLDNLYPTEKPSLVHGDLWIGNFITGVAKPYLIDPAIAFAHREVDIAMTMLFGGFSTSFYQTYIESFPLQKGWQQRVDLWNLYPLMVHLNLFGAGYLPQIQSNLKKFI